jgi:hypothetical protein
LLRLLQNTRNLARTCFAYTFPIPWTKNKKNLVRRTEIG